MLFAASAAPIIFLTIILGSFCAPHVGSSGSHRFLRQMPSEATGACIEPPCISSCTQYDEQPFPPQSDPQQAAAVALLHRLLPAHLHHLFQLCLTSPQISQGSHGWFSIRVGKGKVHIHGTSGVELASGTHWFLKHFAGCSVSWHATGGLQLNHDSLTAAALAAMEARGTVKIERAVPFSFYQNVVTMSYSMAFWDWDRWVLLLACA